MKKTVLLPLATAALALAACSGSKTADNASVANDTALTDNGLVTLNDESAIDGNVALDNGLDAETTGNGADALGNGADNATTNAL